MKEFLSNHHIDFEPVNIAFNPAGQARLKAHGFDGVPIVCSGDRCVSGGDLRAVAALAGLDWEPPVMLPPDVLYRKWDVILDAACRYVRQIPPEGMSHRSPDRDRSFRDLCFHALSIARAFLRAYDEGLPESWRGIMDPAPGDIQTSVELAAYGEETRRLLRVWWIDAGSQDPLDRVIETYQGAQTLHEALERQTWHTAQHTRQIMMFLEQLSIAPEGPLTPEDLAGLPLPERVWD